MLVDALKNTYTLSELLVVLGLARSSCFYHRAHLVVAGKNAGARRVIVEIFEVNNQCCGYRRIGAALSRQKVVMSEEVGDV